jgi:hypothetical protein
LDGEADYHLKCIFVVVRLPPAEYAYQGHLDIYATSIHYCDSLVSNYINL